MKVLLVFPNSPIVSDPCCEGYNPGKFMPYELIHCAGNLETDFETKILDAKAENLDFSEINARIQAFKPRLIVLWTTPYSILKDLKILEIAKKQGATTALILNPPILLKQTIQRFPFIDLAIKDERPFVLKEIAKKIETRKGIANIKGIVFKKNEKPVENILEKPFEYNKLPSPAFHLAPMNKYNKSTAYIISSRGCPFQCAFCFWGNSKWRSKTPEQTGNEVETLVKKYGYKNIAFIDQHFTINQEHVYEFLNEIKRKNLKFNWNCDSRVESADEQFFRDMHKSGLKRVIFGVEHVNQKILENINKNQSRESVEKAIKIAKKTKVREATPFILGLPGETKETIKEVEKFIIKTKPWSYSIFPPIPFPETPLFEQAKKNNWLLVEEKAENFWARPDFSKPLMSIPSMTVEELSKARKRLQIIPRLHPTIFMNTVRDLYMKGGLSKVWQLSSATLNLVKNK